MTMNLNQNHSGWGFNAMAHCSASQAMNEAFIAYGEQDPPCWVVSIDEHWRSIDEDMAGVLDQVIAAHFATGIPILLMIGTKYWLYGKSESEDVWSYPARNIPARFQPALGTDRYTGSPYCWCAKTNSAAGYVFIYNAKWWNAEITQAYKDTLTAVIQYINASGAVLGIRLGESTESAGRGATLDSTGYPGWVARVAWYADIVDHFESVLATLPAPPNGEDKVRHCLHANWFRENVGQTPYDSGVAQEQAFSYSLSKANGMIGTQDWMSIQRFPNYYNLVLEGAKDAFNGGTHAPVLGLNGFFGRWTGESWTDPEQDQELQIQGWVDKMAGAAPLNLELMTLNKAWPRTHATMMRAYFNKRAALPPGTFGSTTYVSPS